MVVKFTLPGLPKSANGAHGNWYAAAAQKKEWRTNAGWACKEAMQNAGVMDDIPWKKVRLTCTRFSTVKMDFDNLVISFKNCVDSLKDCGLITDDNQDIIVERFYNAAAAKRGQGHIEIMVERLA